MVNVDHSLGCGIAGSYAVVIEWINGGSMTALTAKSQELNAKFFH